MVPGAFVVLFVVVCILGEVQRRSRARIARLERTQAIDPATLLGTPFALQRELSHAIGVPEHLSQAEIHIAEVGRAKEAANTLRSLCAHGMDLVFCLDLARGRFLLIVYGKLDPAQVADFFLAELEARRIQAKIGWAYTRSADPAIRQEVRGAAQAAVEKVEGASGVEVVLVEPGKWPADDQTQVVLGLPLRTRREALCLTRKEFARIVGLNEQALRDIEIGRARSSHVTNFILTVADTIEASIARVQKLADLVAAAASRALPSPPTSAGPDTALEPSAPGTDDDGASVAQRAIALQRSILAARAAGSSKGTVPPPPAPSAAGDKPNDAETTVSEQPTAAEVKVVDQGNADADK